VLIRIWYSLVITLFGLLAFQYYQSRGLILATENVCQLVMDHFYESSTTLNTWYEQCKEIANTTPYRGTRQRQIARVQSHLASLGVSHLELWSPSEMSQMWLGEDTDTGIRVTQIESYWIVTEVLEKSPADGVIFIGDEIISVNDKKLVFAEDIEKASGVFKFWRDGQQKTVNLKPEKITYPFRPYLKKLDAKKYQTSDTAVLVLKSFTPVYFDDEEWKKIIQEATKYDKLVLDLRGNSGGDFVVMQKILSSFLCEPTDIGYLVQPRKKQEVTAVFSEEMDGGAQIDTVKNSSVVELQTYAEYPCYLGEINLLIDSSTASTAEIFTEAIKLRKGTHILGQTSSGAVLLAIWYPTLFGKQYSLSIPVALYKNWKDQIIEGEGIKPDRIINFNLAAWRNGVDNWILEAIKY
jgi:carboxyl-terminal processing protease